MNWPDRETYTDALYRFMANTQPYNAIGSAAMSVPLAMSKSGLPIGIHFAAAPGPKALLLRLAGQLEAARPWFDRTPPELDLAGDPRGLRRPARAASLPAKTMVTIFHNPGCGTSRNVLGLIRHAGIEPKVIEYLKTGWTADQLRALFAQMGVGARPIRELISSLRARTDSAVDYSS